MRIEQIGLRVVALAIFIAGMLLLKEFATAAMSAAGWWISIPIAATFIFIAWVWERKDQRDRAG